MTHANGTPSAERPPPTPSPRPTFDGPAHIRSGEAALHLWGDDESGQVADWIYASTQKIHHLVFGLAEGRSFRHSPDFRTVFAADELLYVLQGTMIIANPEIGEVHRVRTGEAVAFGRDTWHHAFAFGPGPLRVLEFFAPPPATGASSAYARTREYLHDARYVDDRWVGRWPAARLERDQKATLAVLRDEDLLWELDGGGTLVGTYVSTDQLTAGTVLQQPGAVSGTRAHGGDASLHVVEGSPFVLIVSVDGGPVVGQRWFELGEQDGFFVPEGASYQLHNVGDEPTKIMFAVAPRS